MFQPSAAVLCRKLHSPSLLGAAFCGLLAAVSAAGDEPAAYQDRYIAAAPLPAPATCQVDCLVQPVQAIPSHDAAPPPMEVVQPPSQLPPQRSLRQFRPITDLTIDAALPQGLLPDATGQSQEAGEESASLLVIGDLRLEGGWADVPYNWAATHLCHGPLYFEEINLERYGYQCHPALQPLVSGAHFFLTVPTLPYRMTVHPPRECVYTLGYYRPGDRAPWRRQRLPWDTRAAAVEATVAVGLVLLIP
ncbi:MAG: hypothetical protein IT424_12990 [Pirellulales bacterium]|nr:hypothetical protein [Pirellulales bacterium]